VVNLIFVVNIKNSPASRGKISMKSHALETDRSGRTEQTVLVETDRYLEKIDLASNVAIDISKVDGFSVLEITRISQVFESCPGLRYRDRYLLMRYRLPQLL